MIAACAQQTPGMLLLLLAATCMNFLWWHGYCAMRIVTRHQHHGGRVVAAALAQHTMVTALQLGEQAAAHSTRTARWCMWRAACVPVQIIFVTLLLPAATCARMIYWCSLRAGGALWSAEFTNVVLKSMATACWTAFCCCTCIAWCSPGSSNIVSAAVGPATLAAWVAGVILTPQQARHMFARAQTRTWDDPPLAPKTGLRKPVPWFDAIVFVLISSPSSGLQSGYHRVLHWQLGHARGGRGRIARSTRLRACFASPIHWLVTLAVFGRLSAARPRTRSPMTAPPEPEPPPRSNSTMFLVEAAALWIVLFVAVIMSGRGRGRKKTAKLPQWKILLFNKLEPHLMPVQTGDTVLQYQQNGATIEGKAATAVKDRIISEIIEETKNMEGSVSKETVSNYMKCNVKQLFKDYVRHLQLKEKGSAEVTQDAAAPKAVKLSEEQRAANASAFANMGLNMQRSEKLPVPVVPAASMRQSDAPVTAPSSITSTATSTATSAGSANPRRRRKKWGIADPRLLLYLEDTVEYVTSLYSYHATMSADPMLPNSVRQRYEASPLPSGWVHAADPVHCHKDWSASVAADYKRPDAFFFEPARFAKPYNLQCDQCGTPGSPHGLRCKKVVGADSTYFLFHRAFVCTEPKCPQIEQLVWNRKVRNAKASPGLLGEEGCKIVASLGFGKLGQMNPAHAALVKNIKLNAKDQKRKHTFTVMNPNTYAHMPAEIQAYLPIVQSGASAKAAAFDKSVANWILAACSGIGAITPAGFHKCVIEAHKESFMRKKLAYLKWGQRAKASSVAGDARFAPESLESFGTMNDFSSGIYKVPSEQVFRRLLRAILRSRLENHKHRLSMIPASVNGEAAVLKADASYKINKMLHGGHFGFAVDGSSPRSHADTYCVMAGDTIILSCTLMNTETHNEMKLVLKELAERFRERGDRVAAIYSDDCCRERGMWKECMGDLRPGRVASWTASLSEATFGRLGSEPPVLIKDAALLPDKINQQGKVSAVGWFVLAGRKSNLSPSPRADLMVLCFPPGNKSALGTTLVISMSSLAKVPSALKRLIEDPSVIKYTSSADKAVEMYKETVRASVPAGVRDVRMLAKDAGLAESTAVRADRILALLFDLRAPQPEVVDYDRVRTSGPELKQAGMLAAMRLGVGLRLDKILTDRRPVAVGDTVMVMDRTKRLIGTGKLINVENTKAGKLKYGQVELGTVLDGSATPSKVHHQQDEPGEDGVRRVPSLAALAGALPESAACGPTVWFNASMFILQHDDHTKMLGRLTIERAKRHAEEEADVPAECDDPFCFLDGFHFSDRVDGIDRKHGAFPDFMRLFSKALYVVVKEDFDDEIVRLKARGLTQHEINLRLKTRRKTIESKCRRKCREKEDMLKELRQVYDAFHKREDHLTGACFFNEVAEKAWVRMMKHVEAGCLSDPDVNLYYRVFDVMGKEIGGLYTLRSTSQVEAFHRNFKRCLSDATNMTPENAVLHIAEYICRVNAVALHQHRGEPLYEFYNYSAMEEAAIAAEDIGMEAEYPHLALTRDHSFNPSHCYYMSESWKVANPMDRQQGPTSTVDMDNDGSEDEDDSELEETDLEHDQDAAVIADISNHNEIVARVLFGAEGEASCTHGNSDGDGDDDVDSLRDAQSMERMLNPKKMNLYERRLFLELYPLFPFAKASSREDKRSLQDLCEYWELLRNAVHVKTVGVSGLIIGRIHPDMGVIMLTSYKHSVR